MENPSDQIRLFLSMFAVNVPTLIVCGIACLLIAGRWQQGTTYPSWAMAGFGTALVLCFLMPAAQTALQHWVFQSGNRLGRAWVFTAFGLVASGLHAAIYGCLLMAIFAGRSGHESREQE
jgi:hypothetical protein